MSVTTKFTTKLLPTGTKKQPYKVTVGNRPSLGSASGTSFRPRLSLPNKPSYVDCRFETDMKLLLGKMDRMEALMEKLIEVVYYQQESRDEDSHHERPVTKTEEGYKMFIQEEHLSDDDNEHMDLTESQAEDYSLLGDCAVEEYVLEDFDDSSQPRKRFKADETPKENCVDEFVLPLASIQDLETFDELVSKDKDVRSKAAAIIDSVVSEDKTFRDIVRHIVTDEVLGSYLDSKSELKNMYLFRVLLKDTYSQKRDGKNFWRRIDSLFGIPMPKQPAEGPLYETDDFRLPIKTIMELEELDRKVRVHPEVKRDLSDAMRDLFLSSDRNNANFLSKLIGKECIDEVSWSSKSRKKTRLMDFTIFNDLYPKTLGLNMEIKQMEDLLRTALNQIRHRYYSKKHRENMKLMLAEAAKIKNDGE